MYTAKGKELVANTVGKLLRQCGFKHTTSQRGLYKAAISERVNKTLQIRIYKYLLVQEGPAVAHHSGQGTEGWPGGHGRHALLLG